MIGVLEGKGGSLGGDLDNQVFVPLTTAHNELYPLRNRAGEPVVSFMYVLPRDGADRKDVIEQIKTMLRARHNISYRDDDDFSVYSQADFLAAFGAIIGAVTVFLSSIAAISLIVGGIGIMNIMLVTVTERTREIGLRKAIGAKRRDILVQFLIEAMTLSLLGGFVGHPHRHRRRDRHRQAGGELHARRRARLGDHGGGLFVGRGLVLRPVSGVARVAA